MGKRIYFWDYVKAISIMVVIFNHSISDRISLGYVSFVRMAVPVFLMVSGVTFSMSLRKCSSLKEWYVPRRLLKKLIYFSIPALCVCIVSMAVNKFPLQNFVSVYGLATFGEGAYYYDILIQLILLFPLIWLCIHKMNVGGWVLDPCGNQSCV